MIKYLEYDSFDEYGQHIIPITSFTSGLIKTAGNFSPELMKVILNMKRLPNRYYVVVNALGSSEYWGCNRNGDAFPESGLSHLSLRTDMNTPNDYGYKTFEYYAKFYQHHVNKDPKKSFGEVVFSYWNPVIHRVELIIAIDTEKAKDIVEALDTGEPVAVSMGCLTNPDYPILTIDGYRPIKDIKVGDLIFTHLGRWKKVTELHRRLYTGKLHTLEIRGLPLPLELTADHPMMAKFFQKTTRNSQRSYINPQQFEETPFEWGCAKHIEEHDHIKYQPVTYSENEYAAIGCTKLAKIMGYYLAEGSFGYNNDKPCTIQFACHMDDDLPRELPKLINELFPGVTCNINPHNKSKVGLTVDVFSTELACFLNKYLGHLAKNKVIPPELFVSSTEVKLSFIGAWLSGDGWCDAKGVHWSSCNINMVLQMRDMLISCGIPASIYKIVHKEGTGFNFHDTTEYTLNISHLDAEPLIPYALKKLSTLTDIINDREKEGMSSIKSGSNGSYSYLVKSVSVRDVVDIQTYNFEVEDDESYIAAGLVSHNCKVKYDRCNICDHKSSTVKQYCQHLTKYLGQLIDSEVAKKWSIELGKTIKSGTQVCAINDYPRFFDLSRVFIGADRVSFVLGKAAALGRVIPSACIGIVSGMTDTEVEKYAGSINKVSNIDKEVGSLGPNDLDGRVTKSDESSIIDKAIDEKMRKAIVAEPIIPSTSLDGMAQSLPLRNIISTMLGMGIQPKPEEFQRIILIRIGQKPVADELERNDITFDPNATITPQQFDFSQNDFSDSLARALMPMMAQRSAMPQFLGPRIEKTAAVPPVNVPTSGPSDLDILGLHGEQQDVTPPSAIPVVLLSGLSGIAALYAFLRMRSMNMSPGQMVQAMEKPWMRNLLAGGAMTEIYRKLNASDDGRVFTPASAYAGALQNTGFTGIMTKNSALQTALVYPLSYVYNSYNMPTRRHMDDMIKLSSINILNQETMRCIQLAVQKIR